MEPILNPDAYNEFSQKAYDAATGGFQQTPYTIGQSFSTKYNYDPEYDKGFNPQGLSQEANRFQNQTGFGTFSKALGRLGGSFLTKLGTGLSDLGGLAIGTSAYLLAPTLDPFNTGYMNSLKALISPAHNPLSAGFRTMEESLKEAMPIYAPDKYYDGDFLDKLATGKWWGESFVDGVAFLGAAWAQGAGVGKLIG